MSGSGAFRPPVLALAAGLSLGLAAAADAATYGTETVLIPLGNTTATGFSTLPTIHVGLSTGAGFDAGHSFTLDTGSTGVVVGPSWTPPPGTPDLGPGSTTYTSSGTSQWGEWYQTTLRVGDANGNNVTVAVPVLRVDPASCGSSCSIAMFGVGFAREVANNTEGPGGTQRAVPANNPLLNVIAVNGTAVTASTPNQPGATGVSGTLTSGYIISPQGLTIGLTAANTQGFNAVPLTWNNQTAAGVSGWADRNTAPLSLTVNAVTGTGTVLNDTGIVYAFVHAPDGAQVAGGGCGPTTTYTDCYASGTSIAVAIQAAGAATAAAAYSYVVGAVNAAPAAPTFTRQDNVSTQPFVNTGLTFFDQFSYFYDYANGQVGYLDRSAAVPAPGALGLFALAIGCLFAGRRLSS